MPRPTQPNHPHPSPAPPAGRQSPPAPPPLLQLHAITKTFPAPAPGARIIANDNINLSLPHGQIHAILGENGSGKSTLMKIIYGYHPPDTGTISINGHPLPPGSPAAARRRGIGMVFQDFSLIPALSVTENIALFLPHQPPILRRQPLERRIRQFAHQYQLNIDPRRRVDTLSLGEQQHVELIKLLLAQARLLIFDEPTSVLAPHETDALFRLFTALRQNGYSILFITHKIPEALTIADQITVLRHGRIAAQAPRPAFTPQTLVTAMIAAAPTPAATPNNLPNASPNTPKSPTPPPATTTAANALPNASPNTPKSPTPPIAATTADANALPNDSLNAPKSPTPPTAATTSTHALPNASPNTPKSPPTPPVAATTAANALPNASPHTPNPPPTTPAATTDDAPPHTPKSPPTPTTTTTTPTSHAATALEFRQVTTAPGKNAKTPETLQALTLTLRRNQILGIAGIAGNGQRAIVETLLGLQPIRRGRILLSGQPLDHPTPAQTLKRGLAIIPENPLTEAMAPQMRVDENLLLAALTRTPNPGFWLNPRRIAAAAASIAARFPLPLAPPNAPVRHLSGGNIQRVLLAGELTQNPAILLACYPTRGLDALSAESVRRLLLEQRQAGAAIILISEDLDELIRLSDRLLVMHRGRSVGQFTPGETTPREIGLLMTGQTPDNPPAP